MSYIIPDNTTPSKILYIDSRDANEYLATNADGFALNSYFIYTLVENIEIPLNQRALISLNSATIPYSFYNIRTGVNDVLSMTARNLTTGNAIFKQYAIPAGNYTAYSLADLIVAFVNVDLQDAVNKVEYTFSMTFNLAKQKFLYTIVPKGAGLGDNIVLDLLFDGRALVSPHIEMGFPSVDFRIGSDVGYYSMNVVDINGSIHGVYIRTNLVSTATLDSQSKTMSNILARVPINVASGGVIFSDPSNESHKSLVDLRTINSITIRLTDERNRILDLNGLHFQVSIGIDFIHANKPVGRKWGGLTEAGGGSYLVSSDDTAQQKILKAQQLQGQLEVKQKRESRRRGPGRPRRVGRPTGSTKINEGR